MVFAFETPMIINDIILMDIDMPRINGLEATRHIRSRESSNMLVPIPIIGISGQAQSESVQKALEVNMNDYITKPFSKRSYLYYNCTMDIP